MKMGMSHHHIEKGRLEGCQIQVIIIINGISWNSEKQAYIILFRPEIGGFLSCETD